MIYYFNRSYEVDETFPNTVVVTIDATHHMRMPPGLMRQVHNHMQANNLFPIHQNATETCKLFTEFLNLFWLELKITQFLSI